MLGLAGSTPAFSGGWREERKKKRGVDEKVPWEHKAKVWRGNQDRLRTHRFTRVKWVKNGIFVELIRKIWELEVMKGKNRKIESQRKGVKGWVWERKSASRRVPYSECKTEWKRKWRVGLEITRKARARGLKAPFRLGHFWNLDCVLRLVRRQWRRITERGIACLMGADMSLPLDGII